MAEVLYAQKMVQTSKHAESGLSHTFYLKQLEKSKLMFSLTGHREQLDFESPQRGRRGNREQASTLHFSLSICSYDDFTSHTDLF